MTKAKAPARSKRLSADEQRQLDELEAWKRRQDARPAPSQEATDRAAAAAQRTLQRRKERRLSPKTDVQVVDGSLHIGSAYNDDAGFSARLLDLYGTVEPAFMDMLQGQLLNATGVKRGDAAALKRAVEQSTAFIAGIAPTDEVEATLAGQMYAVHCATMTLSRHMQTAEMRDQFRDYGSLLVKMSRTYAAQVEALAKLRSGGKQQVEVRYVYVDARGGQNIIGSDVQTGGGGGSRNFPQPHAQLGYAPGAPVPEMRSADPVGLALQGAGDPRAQALPDARGQEPGGSNGQG